MPRLHLAATLMLVLVLMVGLGLFYSWRNARAQQSALERITAVVTAQEHQRLQTELQSSLDFIEFFHQRTEADLRDSLVEQVDIAIATAKGIHEHEAGHRPIEETQQLIVEALRPMRFFDSRGYVFIDDMSGRFVLLPTAPHYEGQPGFDNRDDHGTYVMQGLIAAARQPRGQGFFRYRWFDPLAHNQMADKLAYVRYFAPYDWLIGAGDYLPEWERRRQQQVMARLRSLRFGHSGTVGLIDGKSRVVLSPNDPQLEGLLPEQMPALEGKAVSLLHRAAQNGGGIVEYDWPQRQDDDSTVVARKTAVVGIYQPWGWIVVASMFNDELSANLRAELAVQEQSSVQQHMELLLMVLASLAFGAAGSFAFSRWSRRLFVRYHHELAEAHNDLRVAAIAFQSQDGSLITDGEGVILRVNPAFCSTTGYTPEELIGQTAHTLNSGQQSPLFHAMVNKAVQTAGVWSGEIRSQRKSGEQFPAWLAITAVRSTDNSATITHYVITLTDITTRKAAEEEIHQLAFYDALTHLPNRRLFLDRIKHSGASNQRTGQHSALLLIDLDNFKLINDSLGHERGDLLLQHTAQRLQAAVRAGDTVARLGGDEFAILIEDLDADINNAGLEAEIFADKLLYIIAAPLMLDGEEMQCSSSIGVTLFHGQHLGSDELMKHAELAMYQAKDAGRGTARFYDPEMQAKVIERLRLERALRAAVQNEEFELHYQIQADANRQIKGVEALIRWQHPQLGLVSPAEFIPLAEASGLILSLGKWVREQACAQIARWAADPLRSKWTISINVSGRELHHPDFVTDVLKALEHSQAPAERLKLELTESLLVSNPEDARAKMVALKAHGVRFALDDFGTGYSSLAYLRQLPLSQLKIDRSFVVDLDDDPCAVAIVRTIATLATSLGLEVIAEGVEYETQQQRLAANGCHLYQGYLYGRPVRLEELG